MRLFLSAAALAAVMVASASAQDEDKPKGWFSMPEHGLIEAETSFELTVDKYSVRSKRTWKAGEKCKVAKDSVVQKSKVLEDGSVEVRLYTALQPDGYCTFLWPLKMTSGDWWRAHEAYNSAPWKQLILGKKEKDDNEKK